MPSAAYADELERLGVGGAAAAQALREVLAARAAQEARESQAAAATPDDPATVGVDEHATTGQPRNAHATGEADRDQGGARTAAHLAAEWYPEGLNHPGAMPANVAGRQPANARTQTQTQAQTQNGKRSTGRSR